MAVKEFLLKVATVFLRIVKWVLTALHLTWTVLKRVVIGPNGQATLFSRTLGKSTEYVLLGMIAAVVFWLALFTMGTTKRGVQALGYVSGTNVCFDSPPVAKMPVTKRASTKKPKKS